MDDSKGIGFFGLRSAKSLFGEIFEPLIKKYATWFESVEK